VALLLPLALLLAAVTGAWLAAAGFLALRAGLPGGIGSSLLALAAGTGAGGSVALAVPFLQYGEALALAALVAAAGLWLSRTQFQRTEFAIRSS
jgi:hypothetical protein